MMRWHSLLLFAVLLLGARDINAATAKLSVDKTFSAKLRVTLDKATWCRVDEICVAGDCASADGAPPATRTVDCATTDCGAVPLDSLETDNVSVAIQHLAQGRPLICDKVESTVAVDLTGAGTAKELVARSRSRGEYWWFPQALGHLRTCNNGPCNLPLVVTAGADAKMTIGFSRGADDYKVLVPVNDCEYRFASAFGALVAGAQQQAGRISTEGSYVCDDAIRRPSSWKVAVDDEGTKTARIRLRLGAFDIQGTLEANGDVLLGKIPEQLGTEELVFDLFKDDTMIGKLRARVAKGFSVDTSKLQVIYGDPELDALHDGKSASGAAVVSPSVGHAGVQVRNRVPVLFAADLQPDDSDQWEFCGRDSTIDAPALQTGAANFPNAIEYAVVKESIAPLTVAICLKRGKRTILKGVVGVATQATQQSLPLPLKAAEASVQCDGQSQHLVTDGPIVIPNGSLTGRSCVLTLSCHKEYQRFCDAAGVQVVRVQSQDRAGHSETVHVTWNPATRPALAVEIPVGADFERQAVYDVTLSIPRRSTGGVTYRSGSESTLQDGDVVTDRRFTLRGYLVDKGPTSLGNEARYYVTIPINLTGIRFPANVRNLRRSSQQDNFELLRPQAGVLLTLEPWNFAYRKNPWAVPLRLQAGATFLGNGDNQDDINVFSELGLSVELPLFNAPKDLGSSVAVSVMWEHDLASELNENHFMAVFFGFNLFKLLSSQAASN